MHTGLDFPPATSIPSAPPPTASIMGWMGGSGALAKSHGQTGSPHANGHLFSRSRQDRRRRQNRAGERRGRFDRPLHRTVIWQYEPRSDGRCRRPHKFPARRRAALPASSGRLIRFLIEARGRLARCWLPNAQKNSALRCLPPRGSDVLAPGAEPANHSSHHAAGQGVPLACP